LLHEAGDLVGNLNKAVKVWDWIRPQIDYVKFRNRAAYSRCEENQTTEVKVVLMEYHGTWERDDAVTYNYVPGTRILTSCIDQDYAVMDYLYYVIANRDPTILVYTRRKIVDGAPHPFLRQLVVKFNVVKPTVTPPLPPSPIEPLDEEYEDVTKDYV
jgi:hypothetical protein